MFEPHLPQDDPSASARAEQLASARAIYRYSYTWPPAIAVAAEVPRSDSYSASYIAALLPSAWQIFRNSVALIELIDDRDGLAAFFEAELARIPSLEAHAVGDWYLRVANDLASYVAARAPGSLAAYGELYRDMAAPACWNVWSDDRAFAWQRIAGVNPMTLTRVRALPPFVTIGEREHTRAIGSGSLAGALAEGRLFACDYTFLDGAPTGETFGRAKRLPAPYALFVAIDGMLRPLAIQLAPRPDAAVSTPADGEAWRIAKLAVQVADANHHETVAHLGRTHMVMEAVTLAMHRQLADRHPLHRLLLPHCEYTLPINRSAATNLIAPGGAIDRVFGGTIEASVALVKRGLDGFELGSAAPPIELAARGLDDTDVLREHPYRDDAVAVFGAIQRFVDAYVRIYYPTDQSVSSDLELRGFVEELGADDGGRLRGLARPETIGELITLIANVVWIATGQHAAVNFPQYPYMGVTPNMSGALWGEWPPTHTAEGALLAQLPPYDMALLAIHTVFQLSSVRVNHLGRYGIAHFLDARARHAVDTLEKELEVIEKQLRARDADRYLSYPHLFPSNVPQSIHI